MKNIILKWYLMQHTDHDGHMMWLTSNDEIVSIMHFGQA